MSTAETEEIILAALCVATFVLLAIGCIALVWKRDGEGR
jgi:hypothetical protein